MPTFLQLKFCIMRAAPSLKKIQSSDSAEDRATFVKRTLRKAENYPKPKISSELPTCARSANRMS